MEIAQQLKKSIEVALGNLGISGVDFVVEHPGEVAHGDYATNVAMVAYRWMAAAVDDHVPGGKKEGVIWDRKAKNPHELAELIKEQLERDLGVHQGDTAKPVESITIAGPGFINFKLAPSFFAQVIPQIIEQAETFGNVQMYAGQKILVEHSSPNLFKPFHIGHMMNNAIGESLVRLMRASGASVVTMSFPSDISIGIAKAVFVILEKYGSKVVPITAVLLGDSYVEGTRRYDEDESIHARVKEIADNLFAGKDSVEFGIFKQCKYFNIEYFEEITARLGSHFDEYIFESEAGEVGKKLVLEHVPQVFTESEGAIVYVPDEAKKNLNTAVFINSQGNPTYEAKDLGLLDLKFDRMDPDQSLFVTDYQQIPHFDVVMDAAEKIKHVWTDRSHHIPHGRMSFKGQKMSSRLGGVPLVSEILETVTDEIRTRSAERNISDQVQDHIAIGAIKCAILRAKPGQNINFDPETSLSFEGDSGPYLQYTHARITSLLEKGADLGIVPNYQLPASSDISELEKIIYRLPEMVTLAITDYSPNYIVTYLLDVAHAFNSFYGAFQMVDSNNIQVSAHRLAIARATQVVLKRGLWLLGMEAPEKM